MSKNSSRQVSSESASLTTSSLTIAEAKTKRDRDRKRSYRARQDALQKDAIKQEDKKKKKTNRLSLTQEEKQQHTTKNLINKQLAAANRTPEQTQQLNLTEAKRKRVVAANRTPEQTQQFNLTEAKRKRVVAANRTPEQTQQLNLNKAERKRLVAANRTPEQAQQTNLKEAERKRLVAANRTPEQAQQTNLKEAERKRVAAANRTTDQKQQHNIKDVKRKRDATKQAIMHVKDEEEDDDDGNYYPQIARNSSHAAPVNRTLFATITSRSSSDRTLNNAPIDSSSADEDAWNTYRLDQFPLAAKLSTYRKDPLMAQHLFWEMSGLHRFGYGDTVVHDKEALLNEIAGYKVTKEDVHRCVHAYKSSMDYDNIKVHYCACCGEMIINGQLSDDIQIGSDILKLTSLGCLQLQEIEYTTWKSHHTDVKCLYSVFEPDPSTRLAYHLIPDLVYNLGGDTVIHACKTCQDSIIKKGVKPLYSIASGYDFGCIWRSALLELSMVEKCLISKVRLYADIVKLRASENLGHSTRMTALKGHVIAMRHDGARQAAELLPRLTVEDYIVVCFIGDKERWNNIRQDWKQHAVIADRIQVRPDVIMRWLNVFRQVNCQYTAIPILELTEDCRSQLLKIPEKILDNTHVLDDDISMRLERLSASSTAPTVPDHNNAHSCDSNDHAPVVDENERTLDAVLLNDFNSTNIVAKQSTEANLLRAVQNTLQKASNSNPTDNTEDKEYIPYRGFELGEFTGANITNAVKPNW
jgi:hypothetical protein